MSTDEKSSIQALERLHPSLPMRAGLIERQEQEYKRHGTRCLIANFEVATGKIIAPSIGPTRTNKDFAYHIEKTIATDPEGEWIFVVDQLNIHQSEVLVKLVAKECSIEMELDGKVVGKFGTAGKQMKEFGSVHEIDCRTDNQILVGELTNWRVQKLILRPK